MCSAFSLDITCCELNAVVGPAYSDITGNPALMSLTHIACCLQSVHGARLHTSSQTSSGMPSAYQLRLQPENFFDMRQVKRSERSPDFKHKFIKQAIWLESAPKDLVQLVKQWDDGTAEAQSKVCVPHIACCQLMFRTMLKHPVCNCCYIGLITGCSITGRMYEQNMQAVANAVTFCKSSVLQWYKAHS